MMNFVYFRSASDIDSISFETYIKNRSWIGKNIFHSSEEEINYIKNRIEKENLNEKDFDLNFKY